MKAFVSGLFFYGVFILLIFLKIEVNQPMMYCCNEKTVDLKRGKRGKNSRFSKILSWQVLGGRG
jgi:hypothetical protein